MWLRCNPTTIQAEEFKNRVGQGAPLPADLIVVGTVGLEPDGDPFRGVDSLSVEGSLSLGRCSEMESLPRRLHVNGSFYLCKAPKLRRGPDELVAQNNVLVLECPVLQSLAGRLNAGGVLNVKQCAGLRSLPADLQVGGDIILSECSALYSLGGLREANGDLLIARCDIRRLPLRSVGGSLNLLQLPSLIGLPPKLHVGANARKLYNWVRLGPRFFFTDSSGGLQVTSCPRMTSLCDSLVVDGSVRVESCHGLQYLCDTLSATKDLELTDNRSLSRIAGRVEVRGSCSIQRCPNLSEPADFLSLGESFSSSELPKLKSLGDEVRVAGTLDLSNLPNFNTFPTVLYVGRNLILRGVRAVTRLPPHLVVDGGIDVAGSSLTEAAGYEEKLLWDGVAVNPTIAFHPETMTALDILNTEDQSVREIMLQRFTYERFITKAGPEVLDEDMDRGGERRLLRIAFPNMRLQNMRRFRSMNRWEPPDSAIVCLSVQCPSTGALYIMRVPPEMQTCRQAAAWIAGFDDPDEYRPLQET
jgi:hypothetical protein